MRFNFNTFGLSLSGGNRFIFQLTNALVNKGHDVTIVNCGDSFSGWFYPVKSKIIDCKVDLTTRFLNKYGLKRCDLFVKKQEALQDHIPDCDVNVATYWATAKPTYVSGKGEMYYLVQHYEPLFHLNNNKLMTLAEGSYSYPLKKLCVSKWLVDKVGGVNIGNGLDLNKFKRLESIQKVSKSVMFSFRSADWKKSDLARRVASALKERGFTVVFSCEDISDIGLVGLYNSAVVFVNMSDMEGFGYQMLEAMACGCVVVSTGCSEYLIDGSNFYSVPFNASVNHVVAVVEKVFSDNALASKVRCNGFVTAKKFSFDNVVASFLDAVS